MKKNNTVRQSSRQSKKRTEGCQGSITIRNGPGRQDEPLLRVR